MTKLLIMKRAIALGGFAGLATLGAGAAMASSQYFSTASWSSLFSVIVSESAVRIERDVAYGSNDRQTLDIYRPIEDRGGPIVVFVHGGSWRMGDKETYGFLGAALAARGIPTVVPNYRLYPEVRFPSFVEDAALAYKWAAQHVAGSGPGARPIVLFGHSAGAHIAALLATDRHYLDGPGQAAPRPAGFIGLAGPYAFDPTKWESTKAVFSTIAGDADAGRPVAFADRNSPPALLMHGLDDGVVGLFNMHEFAKALTAAGVQVRQLELPDIGHVGIVLALARPFRGRAPVLAEIVRFVRATPRPMPRQRSVTGPQ